MFKILEFITEGIGWLKIALSPTLIGIGIGAIVYYLNQDLLGFVIGGLFVIVGFIGGVIWATRIWKTKGTVWFLSRTMATPELDKNDNTIPDMSNLDNPISSNIKEKYIILIAGFSIIIILILASIYPVFQKNIGVPPPQNQKQSVAQDTPKVDRIIKFPIFIKQSVPGGDSTGGIINITENGKPYLTINSEGIKYPVALDFNANYLIECSKKGYGTKVVAFDTHIPKGRENEEFANFFVEVELFKSASGKTTNSTKPIGGVRFDSLLDDFDKIKN